MKNNVQLITYADRLSGAGIPELHELLANELSGLFSGVHILPFFYPIDGSDAGFDPIDHTRVDERIGCWQDIKALGSDSDIMADLIVNHASAESKEFRDVLAKGKNSVYWDLFLTKDKVFPGGASEELLSLIPRPKTTGCFTPYQLATGETIDFWTTFTDSQIDLDVKSELGQQYLHKVIDTFAANNISYIRLDAAGFAIKKAGTSCFMIDETFDFINQLSDMANKAGMKSLVEIHSYYKTQIEIAKRVNLVYDFALPPLVLHYLTTRDVQPLVNWLKISPRNCITVLDTHDGIGIEDVAGKDDLPGLLHQEQIETLIAAIHNNSGGGSEKASGAAASNVDIYQVNCSYYDALAKDDLNYLIARAIQFFSPGVPQVYYGGLLALENDMQLLASTNVGRDINRSYLNKPQVAAAMEKPVVKALSALIRLRNQSEAFNGLFEICGDKQKLCMKWINGRDSARLVVDMALQQASISLSDGEHQQQLDLAQLLAGN
ncbi:sucrose phosphorylase [Thalassomonas actiniarum]|uniref:Sucrose phosphorylase n=1 Tax=Thalassomonas actiniarum TaxID=485447 RepID=A0AAE9YPT3_9GAMM|nr:sucrose phosphorylase [Thalassomonas actiniarum]WDD98581.1 sucrose phosphorylase [Thalassomonas actiniarum]